jgi:hypothetical protein
VRAEPEGRKGTRARPQNRRSDENSPDTVTNHCEGVHLAFRWESGRCTSRRHVILRIIWPNFLRTIWHIGATSCPTDHKAFGCRVDPSTNSFVTCPSQLISRIRRISDQNALQKSNVSSRESDDCLCQISSKILCQIIRKMTLSSRASWIARHNAEHF